MRNKQLNITMKKSLQRIQKKNKAFEERTNKRVEEIKDLSKQTDYSNLTYLYMGNNN